MGDLKTLQADVRALQSSVQAIQTSIQKLDSVADTVDKLSKLVKDLLTKQNTPTNNPTMAALPSSSTTPLNSNPNQPQNTFQTRYTKWEFPNFSGKEDPLVWITRCELYFASTGTAECEKVGTAAYHMTDTAQLWYTKRVQDGQNFSWLTFRDACTLRFGPPRSLNPLGELAKLQQNGKPIEEYVDEFQLMLARSDKVHYDQQVALFTSGLDEILQIDVERCRPTGLDEAINLARDYARKSHLLVSSSQHQHTTSGQFPHSSTITIKQPPHLQASRKKRLSPEEMLERRQLGKCYNCDELWVNGHHCKQQLYILGFPEDDDFEHTTWDVA